MMLNQYAEKCDHCGNKQPSMFTHCDACCRPMYTFYRMMHFLTKLEMEKPDCPECHKRLFLNTSPNQYRWVHTKLLKAFFCINCRILYSEQTLDFKNFMAQISKNDSPYFPDEMVERNRTLRETRTQSITPDKDFHEYFCKVLREETNRECDCEGTTSEIRN